MGEIFFTRYLLDFCKKCKNIYLQVKQLVEHLKSYYTTWATSLNAKHTRMSTYGARKELDNLIRNPARLTHAPPIPQYPSSSRPLPTMGLIDSANNHEPVLATSSRIQLASAINPANRSAQKRPVDSILAPNEGPSSWKRARRQCPKCGRTSGNCPGNKGKEKCKNPCRDCNQYDCVGRDSRNHNKKCPNVQLYWC